MGITPWEKAKLSEFGKNRFAMEKAIRVAGVAMRTVGAATLLLGIPAGLLLGEAKASAVANRAPIPLGG